MAMPQSSIQITSHFASLIPSYSFLVQGSRFKVQGSRLWWRLHREYYIGEIPKGLLIAGFLRIVSLPLEEKVPRRGG